MDARTALLAEMVREGERVLDHQIAAMEELDDKSEQMIRLGVASLAGGLPLALLLVRGTPAPSGVRVPATLVVATLFNLVALVHFVEGYIGLRRHREIHVGPSLEWIQDRADEATWTLEQHLSQLVASFPRFHDYNVGRMLDSSTARRSGIYLLMGSVAGYALALTLMLMERS